MKAKILAGVILGVVSLSASALDLPKHSPYDHRIRMATYNAQDVVQIDTVIGITTHIALEPGERYISHAFGDAESYSFAMAENHIFIKPKAEQADTNLIVVTDRRTYTFRLIFKPTRQAAALYSLTFYYPDTATKVSAEKARKKAVADGWNQSGTRGTANTSYEMAGDLEIAPRWVWDDGEFTYFQFPGNVDLPGIWLVHEDGSESIVNRTPEGDSNGIYAVHKIHKKFMLRLGANSALAVYNTAFDPIGVENKTGTQSPAVKRVIVGGDE